MSRLLDHGILLAQGRRLDNLSRGFRGRRVETDDILTGVLILAGVLVGLWLLSQLLTFWERRGGYNSRLGLFLGLCRAHRLRWRDRWLLWRLARTQRLRDPARLFLEPERFEPGNLAGSLRTRAGQLAALRDRLFAEPVPPEAEQDSRPAESPDLLPAGTPLFPVNPTPMLNIPPWTTGTLPETELPTVEPH